MRTQDIFKSQNAAVKYLEKRGWKVVRQNDEGQPVLEHSGFKTKGNQYRTVRSFGGPWIIIRY